MKKYYNKTRVSDSIPHKLRKEGKWYLVGVYHLLTTSYLAREGIENSGSHKFADHIYKQKPRGTHGIGVVVDMILLKLPAASAFRFRYLKVKEKLAQMVTAHSDGDLHVLYVPPGFAREYFEVDAEIGPHLERPKNIHLHGLDLDEGLMNEMHAKAQEAHTNMHFFAGDAFDPAHYKVKYDIIICTGFLDFLDKKDAARFFAHSHAALKPGGRFITAGMMPYKISEYLMQQFAELHTSYRSREELIELADKAGFTSHDIHQDRHKLQTVIISQK